MLATDMLARFRNFFSNVSRLHVGSGRRSRSLLVALRDALRAVEPRHGAD